MPVQFETVAVPVVKGVDLRTAARLVPAPSLLQAVNSRLSNGSSKRYGHEASRVVSGAYEAGYTRPDAWLLGHGPLTASGVASPEAGKLLGITKRDNELLAWNGGSLFSYSEGTDSYSRIDQAAMPALRSAQTAKSNSPQAAPDSADTDSARIVVWYDEDADAVKYSIYDTARSVAVVVEATLPGVTPLNARCWASGPWFHIAVVDTSNETLKVYSINQHNPADVSTLSLGACLRYYDFWKIDEQTTVFIKNADNDLCFLYYVNQIGQLSSDYTSGVEVDLDVYNAREVAICAHPDEDRLGIAIVAEEPMVSYAVISAVTTLDGTVVGSAVVQLLETLITDLSGNHAHITVAPRFVKEGGVSVFDAYVSTTSTTNATGKLKRYAFDENGLVDSTTKWHLQLAASAFRAGNDTYAWVGFKSTLQSLWVLVNKDLNPVGRMCFGTANVPAYLGAAATPAYIHLATSNWRVAGEQRDVTDFTVALGYRERIAVTTVDNGVYAEPGIIRASLDFMPKLRAAQVGRCTYIAGAQLWSYDGEELTEAGFHIAPEVTAVEAPAGALTLLGTYTYRVDLCYRNAQNEEIRSHSLILDPVTLTSTNRSIALDIKTVLTGRTNAYFLVYRTAMIDGAPTSTWNLVNQRDPTSADHLINAQAETSVPWTDDGAVSDLAGLSREAHPGNSGTYLQPFSAPACEIVAAGKDRLWVAGGELPPGQIAPSRLFYPGEVPSFNANINIQVDRNAEPITALGFLGDVAAIFRRTQIYLQDGDGPDNEANGYWQATRLGLADSGALSQESLALIAPGLIYQGPAGFRLLNAAGGMINRTNERATTVGDPVDDQAVNFVSLGVAVVAEDQEVRWYGADKTFVYNYVDDAWSTWTTTAVGAAVDAVTGRAVLAREDGTLWFEAKDVWRDGDRPFTHLVQFPWLHAGELGDFQRVRRIMGIGLSDWTIPHKVRVDIRYDERDFPEEYWEWDVPDPETQNDDTWGAGAWGDGSWGDTASASFRDSVWRWRRRPHRQKCSVFSVVVSDVGSDGPGFTLTALGLELGKKTGLDRIAPVTGGSTASR